MTQDIRGVLKLALEALENSVDLVVEDAYNAEQLYGNYPTRQGKVGGLKILADQHKEAITAIKEALAQPEQEPVAWLITDEKINSLQVDSIQRLIDRARHAHMTDIKLRITGQDEWYQADWLKHLIRATPPQRTEQEQPLPPVEIGVDVTADGASVVAFYRRSNAVMEMFYSQFHPAPQRTEQNFCPRCGKRTNDIHTCTPPQENT